MTNWLRAEMDRETDIFVKLEQLNMLFYLEDVQHLGLNSTKEYHENTSNKAETTCFGDTMSNLQRESW